jgi:spermidine dehydrogenase
MDEDRVNDQRLGMDRPIARRDFLNGVAVSALGLAAASSANAAPQDGGSYYPPELTGMRGSHPGSFEVAHRLRDGKFWESAPPPVPGEDSYDLVIVGAGISGLAAAQLYRAQKPGAKILILDNHDDFGGHAKRNEYALGGRMELINGGTLEIDSPRPYSKIADGLIRSLGIDPPAFEERFAHKDFYENAGLTRGAFFDAQTFGADKLVSGIGKKPWREVLADAPLSARVKAYIIRIEEGDTDYMPGLTSAQKKDRLWRISYKDYLTKIVGADPGVIPFYQASTQDEWGVGIDALSALDVWGFGANGGFQGLKLEPGSAPHMGNTPSGYADGGSYTFHFPDGNATIARLLVRALVPGTVPGSTAEDVVRAQVNYARLDQPGQAVKIRLSSIVVGARNIGTPDASTGVEIAYSRFGELFRVRADKCILASWNMMIPYICPDLPQAQKDGLHYLVKIPLVYTSVAISNWRAFEKLGVYTIYAPGCYHTTARLNPVVDVGGYRSVRSPDDPIIVRMVRVPCTPGLDERTQHRLGHANILATSLETFERNIRDQLGRMLAPGGFDPARDITSITVNRWPHGYAYEYNPLFDPVWAPGQAPHELGRARHGRIAIANSDSGAAAYTDSAIDQAHRAVQELLTLT